MAASSPASPRWIAFLLTVALILPGAMAARSGNARPVAEVHRLRSAHAVLLGSYSAVSAVGDANGDDNADMATSTCSARKQRGRTDVLFGPLAPGRFDPVRHRGFSIFGSRSHDAACNVHGAGDVNGDGLDDIVVGGQFPNGRSPRGLAYVVFGKVDETNVELSEFEAGTQGSLGYPILGPGGGLVGNYLGGAGDVNADGRDDIILGAPFAGSAYVVFGKDDDAPVDLREFEQGTQGTTGFLIETRSPQASSFFDVAGAGDVNADGFDDVIVGVAPGERRVGAAYVVFGKADTLTVDTMGPVWNGFRIDGHIKHSETGAAVSGTGDVNGDGMDDVVVGAPAVYSYGQRGRAYVIFGKRDLQPVELDTIDSEGFTIGGGFVGDDLGDHVDAAGDINNDGFHDVLIGSYFGRGEDPSGALWVVFGSADSRPVKVRQLGTAGFKVAGKRIGGEPFQGSGPGDLDGDGCDDFVVASHWKNSYAMLGCHHRTAPRHISKH